MIISSFIYYYTRVIVESVGAGLILSLLHKYIIGRNLYETCMHEEEEEYYDVVSVATGISDSSTTHHMHA